MTQFSNLRVSRRVFLRAAATAGVGATALALVGCGDDDDDQPAPAAATDQQQDLQEQPAAAQQQTQAQAQQQAVSEADEQQQQQQQTIAQQEQQAQQQAAAPAQQAQQQQEQQSMVAETTGGTLRFSALGGGGSAIDPRNIYSVLAYHSMASAFDFLALHGEDGLELGVAKSMTPNDDATKWTIHLRDDVRFHDGRPLHAEDIAFSIRFLGDWETSPYFAAGWADVDFESMAAVDDHTLEIPLFRPRADYLDAALALYTPVIPDGIDDLILPNGSGPFRVASNDQADGVELIRNEDWWGPAPSLDGAVTIPINDSNARINALKSGEIDFAYQLTPAIGLAEQDNPDIIVERSTLGSTGLGFSMNTSFPPFDDPRLREAMKLAIDRQQMVNGVLLGQGEIGNDLMGLGMVGYNDRLPQRSRDLEQATALFAAAGISELSLVSSEVAPGLVAASELLVGQLAEAGVTLTIEEVPPDAFFSDFARILSTPLQTMYFVNRPPTVHLPSFLGSTATFNPTAFATPEFDEALTAAQSTIDEAARDEHLLRAQEIEWAEGGSLIWGYSPMILAYAPHVSNVNLVSDGLVKFQDIVLSS
ncbi:MAG: ABC transporter substrate-binding protein [Chloroflexi bacterium]|nr:ABC transporter substrate-binding protein [Chloroflexota bacterium]